MHASALSAAVWIATWVAMVLTGCTLDFGKYTGPGDLDASAMDASRSDAGPDAGPRRDAGPDATLDAPTGFLTITSVTPNKGVGNSVQTVRIAGTGFTASTTVTFGGAPSSRVVLVSDVELEADVPVGPEIGAIDVVVAEGSLENTLAGGYRRVNGTIRFRAGIRSLVSSLAVGSTPARVALSTGLLAGGDADVDAVVVTSSPSEVVALSTGDGAGGFGDPATDVSLPVDGLDVTVADFDGDGAEDIVVLQADRVTVYGTASDTLTESSRYVLMGGRALSVLDYDHVGGLDMIVRGDAMSGALSLLRNSGTGVFTTAPPLPLDAMYALNDATTPGDVADFDGDGFVDYAVGARRDPSTPVVLVYLRTASPPAFRATPTAIVIDGNGDLGATVQQVVARDFDGDGNVDLFAVGVDFQTGPARLIRGEGTGAFAPAETIAVPGFDLLEDAAAADFTCDGFPDVVATDDKAEIAILDNRGGTFTALTPLAAPMGSYFVDIAVADLNGDELPDILAVSVPEGSSNGSVEVHAFLNRGFEP